MVSTTLLQALLLVVGYTSATPVVPRYELSAEHVEVLAMRASTTVDPNAVTNVDCTDPSVYVTYPTLAVSP